MTSNALIWKCAQVTIGRSARRASRVARVSEDFPGKAANVVLDLLELTELAWHDCYGDVTPPDEVIADILTCANGDLATLIQAAKVAVEDTRDLTLWAEQVRA